MRFFRSSFQGVVVQTLFDHRPRKGSHILLRAILKLGQAARGHRGVGPSYPVISLPDDQRPHEKGPSGTALDNVNQFLIPILGPLESSSLTPFGHSNGTFHIAQVNLEEFAPARFRTLRPPPLLHKFYVTYRSPALNNEFVVKTVAAFLISFI